MDHRISVHLADPFSTIILNYVYNNRFSLDWCAPAFIMLKTPPGRITGISDVEAFAGDANADNRFHYHFKLYVR